MCAKKALWPVRYSRDNPGYLGKAQGAGSGSIRNITTTTAITTSVMIRLLSNLGSWLMGGEYTLLLRPCTDRDYAAPNAHGESYGNCSIFRAILSTTAKSDAPDPDN